MIGTASLPGSATHNHRSIGATNSEGRVLEMTKLMLYIFFDLAAIGCLVSAFLLAGGASETPVIGLVGGAGAASLGMLILLAMERINSRRLERLLSLKPTIVRSADFIPYRRNGS
jgi:hypothetical protein